MNTSPTRDHFWSQRELASDGVAIERACAALVMNVTEDLLVAADRQRLSNSDLAKALGVSRSNVHRQLSGERNMTLRTLSKLAHVLGLTARVVFQVRRSELAASVEVRQTQVDIRQSGSAKAPTRSPPNRFLVPRDAVERSQAA